MTIEANIEAAVISLRDAASHGDEARNKTLDALRDLQLELETPPDLWDRFTFMGMEIAASRIGQDLGVYQTLADSKEAVSVADFAAKTGAAPLLTRRILRYLASVGQVHETAQDTFTANKLTRILATPEFRGVIYHAFDNIGAPLRAFPDFLASTKYQDISDVANTPAQKAFDTELPLLAYLPSQPHAFNAFQQAMVVQPQAAVSWYSAFPFVQELGSYSGSYAFVDVGGGFGHQCKALVKEFPQLRDRVVLQDLPETIAQIHGDHLNGIKATPHNFFEEQPVKGAHFYYLRNVLHDWPDDKAVSILRHLRDVLEPGSSILIDEIVVPTVRPHWKATSLDLVLMSLAGGIERDLDNWQALLKAAGLRIVRVDTYTSRRQDSIIQAVPL